jgi:hypothetical protein
MLALRKHLDLSNTHDCAIWVATCTAWRGITRYGYSSFFVYHLSFNIILQALGNSLLHSTTSFNPTRNVQRSSPIRHGTAPNHHKFLQFKIPWSKTKLSQRDWITLTETFDNVDPVAAFEHHLFVNFDCPPSSPLFSFKTPTGWLPLTRSIFVDRCNSIWVVCGLGAIFGHGFRIGGTTHLLLSGVDPWIVMKQGVRVW